MTITLIILALTVGFFVWGRVRSDIVALTALAALLISGVLTPTEALAGFSSPIVIMMMGLFVVGGAVLRTGLAKAAGQRLVRLSRGNETLTFLLVMLATAFIGGFVSNTGTVALMMPIVITMATQAGFSASRMLMPLAFAGSLGGMLTLIGTPPNLVIDETLTEHGYAPLEFFSFLPVGIICIIIGIVVLLPLSRFFLTKKNENSDTSTNKTPQELAGEYNLNPRLHKYRLSSDSPILGRTVKQLDLQRKYGVTIVEIRNERKPSLTLRLLRDVTQNIALADTIFRSGDIVYVIGGDDDAITTMEQELNLTAEVTSSLDFYDLGLAELVLMPQSKYVSMRIDRANLRALHNINILAIRRGGEFITDNIAGIRLQVGDVLLAQSQWDNLHALNANTDDWVIIGTPEKQADKVTLDYKAPTAALIMVLMVAAMVFDFIPLAPITAVIVAALLTIFTRCFRNVSAAYRTINIESIVLIAAMMPMSTALEKTGVSTLVSQTLVDSLGSLGPTAMLAGIYITTTLLTLFISNTATAVLMAPIAMVAATQTGISPYPLLFAVTLGASMCFASPFSTPPNALVMKAGNYTFMDYVKVGLPLQLAIGIVMIFVLPLLFPFY